MGAKTKQRITLGKLMDVVQKHKLGNLYDSRELTAGEFNSAWYFKTEQGEFVIKIAHDSKTQCLTYEKDIIITEVQMMKKLAHMKTFHVPEIYLLDVTDPDFRYFIMEYLPYKTFDKAKLSKEEKAQVQFDLGVAMAEMHTVQGDGFGYVQNGLHDTWFEAYSSMVKNTFADAERAGSTMPFIPEILELLERAKPVLDTITTPTFVHFDVWWGNLFVKDGRLASIIDFERAMYGDIWGDFVSIAKLDLNPEETYKNLIRGYNSQADEPIELDALARCRLALMYMYLGCIMYAEMDYRLHKTSLMFWARRLIGRYAIKSSIKDFDKYSQELV